MDLGVDRLAGRIRDPMPQVGDDVLEAPPEHARHCDHRLEAAAQRTVLPPTEIFLRWPPVHIAVQRHRRLFQRPARCRPQSALPQCVEFPTVLRLHRRTAAWPVVMRPQSNFLFNENMLLWTVLPVLL